MKNTIIQIFNESINAKKLTLEKELNNIEQSAKIMIDALKRGNKILICGNGGSAADSQHFAAELLVRFEKNRKSLSAIALTTDTSIMTSCANDFGYDFLFEKQVEGLGNNGDVLVGISTSGNSSNVIKAITKAREKGLKVITLTGKDGGKMKSLSIDCNIIIPVQNTGRIQEVHETIIHTWCKLIEDELFK